MSRFYKFNGFKHLVLYSVLCSFPLAAITPAPIYVETNIAINNLQFGINMQKLINKAWKCYYKGDSNSLIDVMLKIKSKVEAQTGKKININKEIDKIERDVRNKGINPPKGIFEKYKNFVRSRKNKDLDRSICMESYFIDQPAMSFDDYEFLYFENEPQNKNDEPELPLKFVISVSLTLSGMIVMGATPFCPPLGYSGEMMISTGFGRLIDQSLEVYQ